MHRKILHPVLLPLLVLTMWLSLASQIPVVSARIQTAISPQATSGVEGNWQGALEVSGFKLRLVLKISKTPEGKLTATVDSLDQGAKDLAADTITFQDGTHSRKSASTRAS
jgi:hypothetical protein